MSIDGVAAGTLKISLSNPITPNTVRHFLTLLKDYRGSKVGRLLKDGWFEIGKTIRGFSFDENFVIRHKRGTVSFVNQGPNSSGPAFMILFKPIEFFDRKYVAFGQVDESCFEVLDLIAQVSTNFEIPDLPITVDDVRIVE
ncbi:hypothetical protein HDV03_000232 [Kappamyces sp. JEL0829]|nr:hypothetical protein HDV03_000232 [Kappamyces sp. JEL0829]